MSACYVSAGRTEQGNVRRQNEDAILLRDDLGLWAVADGLGGHSAGDLASRMVVDVLGALRRDG
ncbi:serine/threonine-protein phosphatase, partial [Xanthomonas perforans]|nr:serine/threonine-protein phosphatase [Xanthomonas perforans]